MELARIAAVIRRILVRCSAATAVALLLMVTGCPATPRDGDTPNDNDNSPGGGDVTALIVSFSTNFGVSSLSPPISVLYTVTGSPDSIAGFFVPVADASPGAGAIGDRVIVATNLPAGTNRAFSFDPLVAGVGFFRVGVLVTDGATELVDESDGSIQVQGPPAPFFIQPALAVTEATQGDDVFVSFDAGDPEGDVQWRLFYLKETDSRLNPADQLGKQLATGTGNVGSALFATSGLVPGDYELGISATDSGLSVATTVATGNADRIVTIPSDTQSGRIVRVREDTSVVGPTFVFSAPGTSDIDLFRDEAYTIEFSATVTEPGATGAIELFYDDDALASNGFRATIADNLPQTSTSFPLPTDLPEGTWFLGATVRTLGGVSPAVTVYATGRLVVIRNPTLVVADPDSILPVRPSVAVPVNWSTNTPVSAGTVDVFARTVDSSGIAFGPEIGILADAPITTTSVGFASDASGLFEVSVRLVFLDGTSKVATAPQHVRVSSLPAIVWLGLLADPDPAFDGAIFGGVNFEDNAGSAFSTAGDLDGDGLDEFVIAARYGKPFFVNPSGVGPGEGYVIYGRGGVTKLSGEYNLNSVGTSRLRGVTLTGIRTPQSSNETVGMSSVTRIPDVDGDGRSELVFGFPNTASRGHNVSSQQDGVVDPRSLSTLERENQFLRGGIVIVSSQNSILGSPAFGDPVIELDLVGQDFDLTCVQEEADPPDDAGDFFMNVHADVSDDPGPEDPGCEGTCLDPTSGGKPDATEYIDFGFVAALARDYFSTYVYSVEYYFGVRNCEAVEPFLNHECINQIAEPVPFEYCAPFTAGCEPFSPGLHTDAVDPDGFFTEFGLPTSTRHSGFYVSEYEDPASGDAIPNVQLPPFGARIIGVGIGDLFGTSLTLSGASQTGAGDIIVSSPGRTARGILFGRQPAGCDDPTLCGGEIDGLESSPGTPQSNPDSGVAYLFPLRSLWTNDSSRRIPPKPHQYIVGEPSHCGGPVALIPNIEAIRIVGQAGESIRNIAGIDDFNNDGRDDFAVGAPTANAGEGRLYIGYRRALSLEGDYVLEKLALAPTDPGRLAGMFITTGGAIDGLGASLATGFDFNADGISDLVIGSPNASGQTGEIIVLFGSAGVVSPAGGITVNQLLQTTRTATGKPVAARITGPSLDTNALFGFNLVNAGDIDGDGFDDLLVAAPNASPRFDPDPNDGVDQLTEDGLDLDFDGLADDVDDLTNAGIVYVIFGSNRLDQIASSDITVSIDELGSNNLRGMMIVGRHAGDRLGGGDAGDVSIGGISGKVGRGRSNGLAAAGDVDGDGRADFLIGSVLADPRRDPNTGSGIQNGGEAYLIYGSVVP